MSPRDRDAHPIQLDLHGSRVDQAKRRVRETLTRARATRTSPVLIITGKGMGSLGGTARLRPEIEAFLRGPEGRNLGVTEVRAVQGGGALSVRLSR